MDNKGKIVKKYPDEDCLRFEIEVPSSLMEYIVQKGYIAVDGTSLTVNKVTDKAFEIMLIQYTQGKIILADKNVGDEVNVETDFMGKQIVAYLKNYQQKVSKSLPSKL